MFVVFGFCFDAAIFFSWCNQEVKKHLYSLFNDNIFREYCDRLRLEKDCGVVQRLMSMLCVNKALDLSLLWQKTVLKFCEQKKATF